MTTEAENMEVEDQIEEETQEESKEEEVVEDKTSIIDTIKEKVFGKKEEVEEESEPEVSEAFMEIAKDHFSEKDIKDLAKEYTKEELEKLIPFLLEEEEEDIVEEEEGKETKQLLEIDDEKLKPYLEKLQEALDAKYSERINALENSLKVVDNDRAINEAVHRQEVADSFFDRVSKKLPVFGETEKLHKFPSGHKYAGQIVPIGKAYDARQEVWEKAKLFNQLGLKWSDSLEDALAWYKGRYGEKELKESMIKDLKKNEKRLSPRRSSSETVKKFDDPYQEKLAIIEEAKRKAGIS